MTDTNPGPPPAGTPPPAAGPIPGERHVSEVAGRGPVVSRRAGIGVLLAGAAVLCGVIVLTTEQPDLTPAPAPELTTRPVVRFEPPPPQLPAPVQPVVPPAPPQPPPLLPDQSASTSGAGAGAQRPPPRPSRLLVYTSGGGNASSAGPAAGPMSAAAPAGTPAAWPGLADVAGGATGQPPQPDLQSRLTPTRLTGVSASVLPNQPYLLTMGNVAPCILQTAMDSTLPGLVACVIPQDVQGKTGLTLLDRGTRVVGEFRGGVSQGVERLFVLWTRAETPQGVVVRLDSPATDPLGRSGMEGDVDRRFWQRFGSALLLSTVDGVVQAGVAAASKQGSTTISTADTQGVIAEALRGSVAMAPTVRKNQGELVSIFVARDLDFSTVYRVQPAVPRPVVERGGHPQ